MLGLPAMECLYSWPNPAQVPGQQSCGGFGARKALLGCSSLLNATCARPRPTKTWPIDLRPPPESGALKQQPPLQLLNKKHLQWQFLCSDLLGALESWPGPAQKCG